MIQRQALVIARAWVPPAVIRLYWRIFPRFRYIENPGAYRLPATEGWESDRVISEERTKWEAFRSLLASTQPVGFSHEEPDLSVVRNLYHHNVHLAFAYVLGLTARKSEQVSVLDWGGGLGHYYLLGRALLPSLSLDYHVRELPRMTATGGELLPEVHWHSDDVCLEAAYDLVFVNGSLQCMANWRDFLVKAARAVRGYFFLTRVPVVQQSHAFAAVQTAYGTRMLHWQFNEQEILQLVQGTGLVLVREVLVGGSPYIRGAPEQPEMRGWLFKR